MQQAVDSFLRTVLKSGLLTREQLQDAVRALPRERRDDPRALADHLIRTGRLSRFQAQKLLKGTSLGLILGPYQVLSPIGKGGMGTVYLARDSRSQQLLALKVLPPKKAREEDRLLARFRREMEMCRRVAHKHLAYTYDAGVEQGVYYIAMEYIPGKSLYRLVHDHGPLDVQRAARLFAEVCSALDHAHGQGLIHRDLKPSNILVTPNDHAKVLDLGLALMQGETGTDRKVIGGQGYVLGSMDYIAPEQTADASRVDARSDIYGLGCTLYFALAGRPPFPGGTAIEKIQRHRSEEPAWLAQRNPAVPPRFAAVVHRMMAKAPEQRYASAAEVEQELRAWSQGAALPMDRPNDQAFEQAVAALREAEAAPELVADELPILQVETGPPSPDSLPPWSDPDLPAPPEETSREHLLLVVGLGGFWVILLLVLGLIWVLR
jgi:serine/threonine protein kinase